MAKENVFGTPILILQNLGIQYSAQLEQKWWQNFEKQQAKHAAQKLFISCYTKFHSHQFSTKEISCNNERNTSQFLQCQILRVFITSW